MGGNCQNDFGLCDFEYRACEICYVFYASRPILPVALRDLPWDPIRGSVDDLMAGFTGTLSAETKVALQSRRVHVMTVRHVQSVVIYILLPRRMPMAFSHT